MSRLHIMQQVGKDLYNVIVHAPTPAGSNSAGILWSDALKNSGLAVTSMPIGTGPGQITTAESTQVAAGTVIEASFRWGDNPTWDSTTRLADLNTRAGQAVQAVLDDYGSRLKFFGLTVA